VLTIAWDVDDVLNDLTGAWFRAWPAAHGACDLSYEQLTENPPHRLLGVSREEFLDSLDTFRSSAAGQDLPPDPRVSAWFAAHGARCRHLVLTATPLFNAPASAAWVLRHFGVWVRCYAVVPSPRPGQTLPDYDTDKGGALDWLGVADVLVDDSAEAVAAARRRGRDAVLVPRPWNGAAGDLDDALAHLTRLVDAGTTEGTR
jgi:hypothetical protein